MMRTHFPWPDLPDEATIRRLLERLAAATDANCTCGGKAQDKCCVPCQTWHYVYGFTERKTKGGTNES